MKIVISDTIEETCRALTEEMLFILHKIKDRDLFIAVSGGTTPKYLFDIWAHEYLHKIDWKRIQLFFVDERCVNPTDKESNYHMTVVHLIGKVPLLEKHIHRIHGESNPFDEAQRYDSVVRKILPWEGGVPVFDLTILGVGSDGHIASLFPDQFDNESQFEDSPNICDLESGGCNNNQISENDELKNNIDSQIYKVALKKDNNQFRITMTLPLINRSKNIFLLLTGKEKKKIVKGIICESDDFYNYPVSRIYPVDGKVSMFVDKSTISCCFDGK
ncbi:MAG: 6-phosphogluconolactonase [Bacteroidales bacterium]|nr:6-phosphogluconolactonase [Bacteroidales bacterium]